MSSNFKRIALVGRYRQDSILDTLTQLCDWLENEHYEVKLESQTAQALKQAERGLSMDKLCQETDLIIVLGGDGSFLGVACSAAEHQLPVLGINHGRLGFLTDIHPSHCISEVAKVLAGDYLEEKRFLLETILMDTRVHESALNDVVLSPGPLPHMIEFEIYINAEFVCRQRADGLIIATPTGSTAYALSGGGPILSPDLEAIVLVPMFPHTLSSRPIVIDSRQSIKIALTLGNEGSAQLSCDGRARIPLAAGSHFEIQRKKQELRLIHPKHYHYFETLRSKLGWTHKPEKPSF